MRQPPIGGDGALRRKVVQGKWGVESLSALLFTLYEYTVSIQGSLGLLQLGESQHGADSVLYAFDFIGVQLAKEREKLWR